MLVEGQGLRNLGVMVFQGAEVGLLTEQQRFLAFLWEDRL